MDNSVWYEDMKQEEESFPNNTNRQHIHTFVNFFFYKKQILDFNHWVSDILIHIVSSSHVLVFIFRFSFFPPSPLTFHFF